MGKSMVDEDIFRPKEERDEPLAKSVFHQAKFYKKKDLEPFAREVLDLLATKKLAVWQVKHVLSTASRLAEWTPMG